MSDIQLALSDLKCEYFINRSEELITAWVNDDPEKCQYFPGHKYVYSRRLSETFSCTNSFNTFCFDYGISSKSLRKVEDLDFYEDQYETICHRCTLVEMDIMKSHDCQPDSYFPKLYAKYVSATFLAFVGGFLVLRKKFRNKHPYPLLGWACLFQSIYYFNFVNSLDSLISFNINYSFPPFLKLTRYDLVDFQSTAINGEAHDSIVTMRLLAFAMRIIGRLATNADLITHSFIILDLHLTLKNPFYPRYRRAKKYWTFLMLYSLFTLIYYGIVYSKYDGSYLTLVQTDLFRD